MNNDTNKHRIVHINTNDIKGGAAKFVWRLWNSQMKKGIDSNIIVGTKESNNPNVIEFPAKIDIKSHRRCLEKGLLYYDLKGSHRLIEYPAIANSDLIHFHNIHGGYFNPFSMSALSVIKPSVWTLHDMYPFTGHCVFSFECNNWESGCISCPNLDYHVPLNYDSSSLLLGDKALIYKHSILNIVTPTRWMQDRVERSVLKRHNIRTIYHGIDMCTFRPSNKEKVRKKLGVPAGKVVIGSVANGGAFGDPRKGGYYISKCLDALDNLNIDYIFINIGAGNVSGKRDGRIIDTGYINDEALLADYYSSLDLFLFPSLAESFGLVVLEALACGVPVVAFDNGAIREIVQDGKDGIIVDYKDVDQLIKVVLDLTNNPNRCMEYSYFARENAQKKFSLEVMQQKYDALYTEAVEGFGQRSPEQRFFNLGELQDVVLSDSFLKLESCKDKPISFFKKRCGIEPRITLIYNGELNKCKESATYKSLMNQTYKNKEVMVGNIEEIDIAELKCDLVYYVDEGFVLHPDSIGNILDYYCSEEALCFMNELIREDGTAFYKAAYPDIDITMNNYRINLGKYNGIIFRKDYFLKNIEKIKTHDYSTIEEVDFLNYKLAYVSLKTYIANIIAHRAAERNYIFGAGGHTRELMNYMNPKEIRICGIIDNNKALRGTRIEGYEVFSYDEISNLVIDNIIISSAMYEQEIFDRLKSKFEIKNLVRIYGGLY